ncbi:energy-coupling factor ABC transporter permease [Pseudomonas aegrilactucae]|uniref:Energy-coupling factor ABC transporter permease n=1 Tax=Pseudomonas aegrilactucae TaxID=2854028 RepID=A0A9Q2XPC4_9PSED|nr:energy-coupling factor ABC transporter permease [Pseudomonas aegrilactucae]MBV6289944.1 energy-coupling factor ABC transporter permease [Pseudomonas aegrilactucae]
MVQKGYKPVIGAQVLSDQSLVLGWLGYVPLLLWAMWRTSWVELFADRRRQHLMFGTMFALFALWLVRRDFDTGVSYHFIGMTAVTLLLDWPLAIVGALVAQVGLVALGRQDLAAMGVNGLLLIGLPVLVTQVCAMLVERAQPRNLFVYIFFSGFFAAALSALLCLGASLGLLWLDGRFAMPEWLSDFIGYLWLIIFPEAFINGMVISALVVFCPEWLETFNRTRYLQAPWKDDEPRA